MAQEQSSISDLLAPAGQPNDGPNQLLLNLVRQHHVVLTGEAGERQVLVEMLGQVDDVYAPSLALLASDPECDESVRSVIIESLLLVLDRSPQSRPMVMEFLRLFLEASAAAGWGKSTPAIQTAIELQAKELAYELHELYADDRVDTQAVGTWDELRQRMQIEDHDLVPPDDDDDSDDAVGIWRFDDGGCDEVPLTTTGVFSQIPVFDDDGDLTEAYEDYVDCALSQFMASPEWDPSTKVPSSVENLLRHCAECEGCLVEDMNVESVRSFLFDYLVERVVMPPDAAETVVAELKSFWEFIHRQYQLPNASSILQWLDDSRLVAEFQRALQDDSEFGVAKYLASIAASRGYDVTNKEDLERFTAAFNDNVKLASGGGVPPATEPGEEPMEESITHVLTQPRIGRNEPCPCGSGKKFKKCCQRHGLQDD